MRAHRPDARRCSSVLPAATCGPAGKRTAPPLSVPSATPNSWAPTDPALAAAVAEIWPGAGTPRERRYVVCTGGEPLLQLDAPLVEALHAEGFEVGVETNGTKPPPPGLDWICVSPKAGADLVLTHGDELKLVYPQPGALPEHFTHLDFTHFFLQPMDGPDRAPNTQAALEYCLEHPPWRLSLQTHKILDIP